MHKKIVSSLYFQVILAITIGICLGHVYPSLGADMKPLGDGFVKLIKMIIAPHFLYRGHRHCRHGKHEGGGQNRCHCADLF